MRDESRSDLERLVLELAKRSVFWDRYGVEGVVRLAVEAIVAGLDSPSLRQLAGLSIRHSDEPEVRSLLAEALKELGALTIAPDSVETTLLDIRTACEEWLDGRLPAVDLIPRLYALPDPEIVPDLYLAADLLEMLRDHFDWYSDRERELTEEARSAILGFVRRTEVLSPLAEPWLASAEDQEPIG